MLCCLWYYLGTTSKKGVGFMLKMSILVEYWKTHQVRATKKYICGTSSLLLRISSNLIIVHMEVSKTVIDIRFVSFAAQKRSSTRNKSLNIAISCYSFPLESSWRQYRWTRDEETVARAQGPLHPTILSVRSWGMLLPGVPHHFSGKTHAIIGVQNWSSGNLLR